MAKRIALYSISASASKYKKTITPLFSFNADFYIRLFLVVKDSAEECKNMALRHGYMLHCRNCQNRIITPLAHLEEKKKRDKVITKFKFNNISGSGQCEVCDSSMCLSGPFWIDSMYDEKVLDTLIEELNGEKYQYLKYNDRILSFVTNIKEEYQLKDQIFSYDYSLLCREITLCAPKLNIIKYICLN
jgi:tRNA G26 N,N-dimethylase Trm1